MARKSKLVCETVAVVYTDVHGLRHVHGYKQQWKLCTIGSLRPHQLNFLFLIPLLVKNICFIKIKTQYTISMCIDFCGFRLQKNTKILIHIYIVFFKLCLFFPLLPRCFLWIWGMRNRKFICYGLMLIYNMYRVCTDLKNWPYKLTKYNSRAVHRGGSI